MALYKWNKASNDYVKIERVNYHSNYLEKVYYGGVLVFEDTSGGLTVQSGSSTKLTIMLQAPYSIMSVGVSNKSNGVVFTTWSVGTGYVSLESGRDQPEMPSLPANKTLSLEISGDLKYTKWETTSSANILYVDQVRPSTSSSFGSINFWWND